MADLTTNAYIKEGPFVIKEKWVLDNSAAQTVYKGGPMILDLSADTVHPRMFVDATVVAATDIFIGIASEGKAVATADTETDNEIEIIVSGWVGFPGSVFTDADVGDTVYMSDSATLSATAADNPQIGRLRRVRDGFQWVEIIGATICAGA